ncbi:MAG: glycosyltransferase family 9 protein [Flavobacteriaceae bacterium]
MKVPKHIVVLRLSALGDVAMTIPVLLSLQKKFPEVKLTIVSRPFFKPLFDQLHNVSFWAAELEDTHKGFWGLRKLAKEIKTFQPDAIADLHNVLRTKVVRTFLKFSGISWASINKGRTEKKLLVNAQGNPISPLKTTHERYADVFRELGFDLKIAPPLYLQKSAMPSKVLEFIGNAPKKLIGIAPFAAFAGKIYPLEQMRETLDLLEASGEYQIVLFGGGEAEHQKLETLSKGLKTVSNSATFFSLEEELSLISNLDLMVSMDSANGHLAAMFGIPVLTLWGITHPFAGFIPFYQPMENQLLSDRAKYPLIPTSVYGNKCPQGYENAIQTIAPMTIVERIRQLV